MNIKIIAAIVVGIAAVGIITAFGVMNEQDVEPEEIVSVEKQEQTIQTPVAESQEITSNQLRTYRFETQCELLYGMTHNEYPNGEPLQGLVLSSVVQKYRSDYAQWEDILFDDQKRIEFFANGMPYEFAEVFAESVSKEYSINPELHSTVMLAFVDQGPEVVPKLFYENNCDQFFVDKLDEE